MKCTHARGENTTEFYDLGTTIVDLFRVFKEMISYSYML